LTYLVAINGESSGQPVTNVIGIKAEFSSADEVANAVRTAWVASGGPLSKRPSQYTLQNVTATDLATAHGAVGVNNVTATGGITGALATNAASALISYGGGSRARSSKGRMYHGPLTEAQINSDGRTIAPLDIGVLGTCYTQFKNQLSAGGFDWVVISRKFSTTNPVGTIACQPTIATQRRRIRGRS
jgi:hypothetical protein